MLCLWTSCTIGGEGSSPQSHLQLSSLLCTHRSTTVHPTSTQALLLEMQPILNLDTILSCSLPPVEVVTSLLPRYFSRATIVIKVVALLPAVLWLLLVPPLVMILSLIVAVAAAAVISEVPFHPSPSPPPTLFSCNILTHIPGIGESPSRERK